mgnify:CR=1 FL=1
MTERCDVEIKVSYRKVKTDDPRFKISGEIFPIKEEPGVAVDCSMSIYHIIPDGAILSMNSHDYSVKPWHIPEEAYSDLFRFVRNMQKDHTLLKRMIGTEYCKIKGTFENPDAGSMKAGIRYCYSFLCTIFKENGRYSFEIKEG